MTQLYNFNNLPQASMPPSRVGDALAPSWKNDWTYNLINRNLYYKNLNPIIVVPIYYMVYRYLPTIILILIVYCYKYELLHLNKFIK